MSNRTNLELQATNTYSSKAKWAPAFKTNDWPAFGQHIDRLDFFFGQTKRSACKMALNDIYLNDGYGIGLFIERRNFCKDFKLQNYVCWNVARLGKGTVKIIKYLPESIGS